MPRSIPAEIPLSKVNLRVAIVSVFVFFVLIHTKNVSAATIFVPDGGSLQSAIDASQCGDSIVLQAGSNWDGTFILPSKGCSQTFPITITSSSRDSLPNGRVSPADAANMPRVRTLGAEGNGAFKAANGAAWWVLDGLEITDNAGTAPVNALIMFGLDATGVHDMTLQRCYVHQKETGFQYERSALRGVWSESNNPIIRWNYIGPFIGYGYGHSGGSTALPSSAFLNIGASSGDTLEDNFLSAWYATIFLGGADTTPAHTATIANGATNSSAILSDVTNLRVGVVLRLELDLNVTVTATDGLTATLMRNSGASLSSVDILRGPLVFPNGSVADLTAVSGNTYTIQYGTTSTLPVEGRSYDVVMYKTAMVTGISGNLVTYTPFGNDFLSQAPSTPGGAAWAVDGESLINNMTIRRNTFYVDPAFALDVLNSAGQGPKGFWEFKNCYNIIVEGNRFLGYPAVLAWTGSNQYGTAPWITVSHITIRNNWFSPDFLPDHAGVGMVLVENQYRSGTPPSGVEIYNNLFRNVASLLYAQDYNSFLVNHNTVINDRDPGASYNSTVAAGGTISNWQFKDNIIAYQNYGMTCVVPPGTLGTCWPGGLFSKNVVIDNRSLGVFSTSTWGPDSILGPIVTAFSGVGFADAAADNYRLSAASPYKNAASDGTDPGVDMDILLAALDNSTPVPTPTPTTTPTPTPTPTTTPTPTPEPTPTPTPTPEPTPTPTPTPEPTPTPTPTPEPTPTPARTPAYQGYLDNVTCATFSGWVRDVNNDGSHFNVDIIDAATGQVIVGSVPASSFRPDLLASGVGDGTYGFSTANPLHDGQTHSFAARITGTAFTLTNYQDWVTTCSAPTPTPAPTPGSPTPSARSSVERARAFASSLVGGNTGSPMQFNTPGFNEPVRLVPVSDLLSLVSDIESAYADFTAERNIFGPVADEIDTQIRGALYFSRAAASLADKPGASTSTVDYLLKLIAHLSVVDDLMVYGSITPATETQALNVNARVALVIGSVHSGYTSESSSLAPASVGALLADAAQPPLGSQTVYASLAGQPLPYELGGVTVSIGGQAVPLIYVSPSSVTFYVPADLDVGDAEIIVGSQEGYLSRGVTTIARNVFDILTSTDAGNGPAQAMNSSTQSIEELDVSTATNFGSDKRTRVTIFATGVSGSAENSDTSNDIIVDGVTQPNLAESIKLEARRGDGRVIRLPVEYAGPQGRVPGLDQVNFVLAPELQGAGLIQLTLLINGERSNAPTIAVR